MYESNPITGLLRRGPRTSAELVAISGTSQATVSRALSRDARVIRMRLPGTRAPVYGMIDALPDLPAQAHTVYRVTRGGQLSSIGQIAPISGAHFFWYENLEDPARSRVYESLPWFLQDMRPQGFLGRATVRHYAARGWPTDLNAWSDRHVLSALVQSPSHDHIGNLLIGDRSAEAFRAHRRNPFRLPLPSDPAARLDAYRLAVASIGQDGFGSGTSVNGEQPKFCVDAQTQEAETQALLVKFTAPVRDEAGQRWSDLLRMEHRALRTLATRLRIPAARTAIQFDGERAYLEVERFDRLPDGSRIGVLSFAALDAKYVGQGSGWQRVARALAEQGQLEASAPSVLQRLECFAELIGNTDRHLGNMSVHFEGQRPMPLTPVYDFLPMRYAPNALGMESGPLDFSNGLPDTSGMDAGAAQTCLDAAIEFWTGCCEDPAISPGMRGISAANAQALRARSLS